MAQHAFGTMPAGTWYKGTKMTVGSKVNPNFPIPGIDQSSRGFRDNFSTIKQELENLQAKRIQLAGSVISDPIEIGNGNQDVIIPVNVNLTNIQAAGENHSLQYNLNNTISGSTVYFVNDRLGINTQSPVQALDVMGNAVITSGEANTTLALGNNLLVNAGHVYTEFAINGKVKQR